MIGPQSRVSASHVVFCDGGLANRLNSLLFALILQQRYSYSWDVAWPQNNWCGAAFGDLFSLDLPVHPIPLRVFAAESDRYHFLVHENQMNVAPSRMTLHTEFSGFDQFADVLDRHAPTLYYNNVLPRFVTVDDLRPVLPRLRVSLPIAERAAAFCKANQINRSVFGLHIRKTDFGNLVDDEGLYHAVSSNPNRFFICSDDAKVTERFGQLPNCHVLSKLHYPTRLIADETDNSWVVDADGRRFSFNVDRSAESVVEGLIDLLILSQTSAVRVSHSTFFNLALIFGATDYFTPS